MKSIKTKWKKNGKEIDAYVHISDITISKGRFPSGRSGGSGSNAGPTVPTNYGSIVKYHISEDKEGKNIISRGQTVQDFDVDDINSINNFAKNALKKIPHLKNMKEE